MTVNITVTGVNEPPAIAGEAEVTFNENPDVTDNSLGAYTADDPETSGDDNTSDVTWSVAGPDGSKFTATDGMLEFKVKPDYEMPTDANTDNVYEVTVQATDGDSNRGMKMVKVTVENEDEDGVVALSKTQPRVGIAVTASLTDPDGSISGLTWQWYNDAIILGNLEANAIEGANSDTYIPKDIDADPDSNDDDADGVTLYARVSYTDEQGADKFAVGTAANPVAFDTRNKAPVFDDQDTETDDVQNETATRKVEENTEAVAGDDAAGETDDAADNVGMEVMATDPDPNAETPTYTLSGADAAKFRVRANGQIEVGSGTELNYETKQTYMVTLTAEDSFGASTSIIVTIMVTDVDEAPDIMLGGLAISGMSSVDYPENGMGAVGTYMATGPDAAMASWRLSGDDMGDFSISNGGMLTFNGPPDYENPTDMGMDNMYMVTLEADDGTNIGTHVVTVTVTNVAELGTVSGHAAPDYAENGMDAVATYTADGPDAAMATWSLSGDDADAFSIDGGMLMFVTPPDFESPADADMNNVYQVTLQGSDDGDVHEHAWT